MGKRVGTRLEDQSSPQHASEVQKTTSKDTCVVIDN